MNAADGPKSTMTLMEILDFLSWPLLLSILSVLIVPMSALLLLLLVLNPRSFNISNLIALSIVVVLSILLLRYLYIFFSTMIRRKQKTGSYLLSGEELHTYRLRWKNPLLWKKVAITAFFFFIAFGTTYGQLKSPHYQASFWIIPVLMWLIAIIIAIDIFLINESKWPLAIVAISYCLAAISSTYFKMSNLHHQGSDWFFPALMWLIAIICVNGVFRSTIQKCKITGPEEPQMPTEVR
jgi:hypothetical protein